MIKKELAADILLAAIEEGKEDQLLNCLFEGGSATVDSSGNLVMIDSAAVESLHRQSLLKIGWVLKRKVETEADTRLFFERVLWWEATEVGRAIDRGMGAMFVNLSHEEAASFVCGQQYVFAVDCAPVPANEEESIGKRPPSSTKETL